MTKHQTTTHRVLVLTSNKHIFKDTIMTLTSRLIAAAAFTLASGLSFAQTSANLELQGTVAVNCTIKVTPTAKATTLDLVGGESATHVADVTETCNSPTGYDVAIRSVNAGQLVPSFAGGTPASYELAYEDAAGSIADGMKSSRDNAEFGRVVALNLTMTGNAQALAGRYNDTVQLTIAAK
jgi:spore coat protein U-like protein